MINRFEMADMKLSWIWQLDLVDSSEIIAVEKQRDENLLKMMLKDWYFVVVMRTHKHAKSPQPEIFASVLEKCCVTWSL